MATQILAVDDSATMRKILEITFAGTEFHVVTVDRADAALQKVQGEAFGLVISDITLAPTNGYDLCKQVKQASPSTPVLLLSSRQNPYDNAAGAAAGADDHIDKPFDTQQLIDRVQKLLREGVGSAPTQAQPQTAQPAGNARARTLLYGGPGSPGMPAPAPAPAAAAAAPTAPAPTPAQVGAATMPSAAARGMGFGAGNPMAKPAAAAPAPAARAAAPAAAAPAPSAAPAPAARPAPAVAAVSNAVNGQLAAKVGELGLTPAQAEAVMALSREVIERVVWEVVPVLAETLIKEEISRLTK